MRRPYRLCDLYLSSAYELNPIKLADMNMKQSHSILSSNLDSNNSLLLLFVTINILLYNLLVWFCHYLINCIMVSRLVLMVSLSTSRFAGGGNKMKTFNKETSDPTILCHISRIISNIMADIC